MIWDCSSSWTGQVSDLRKKHDPALGQGKIILKSLIPACQSIKTSASRIIVVKNVIVVVKFVYGRKGANCPTQYQSLVNQKLFLIITNNCSSSIEDLNNLFLHFCHSELNFICMFYEYFIRTLGSNYTRRFVILRICKGPKESKKRKD